MKRNPPNPPELAHTSLPPGSPPWPLCPQSLLPFLVPQRLSRWTLFRGLLWGRHCAKCWGHRKTWQSHSCFRELTVWQANVAWSRKSSNSRMENKYYKEVEVLKVLLEPLKHMVLRMVAIFLGQLSPNQIISLPTWWLHHHITHTHTHTHAEPCSASMCVMDENQPALTQGCAVWMEKHQTWAEGVLHLCSPAPPTPPRSAFIRPGQGGFCPRKGQKGCMAGTKAIHVPPGRLTWASWRPSSWCALQTPASGTPPGAPTRRAESPGKLHPSCESTHHACRPWTCLGMRRAEVGRRCKGCPDRGPGTGTGAGRGHRLSRGSWDPPLQLPTQAEIPFSGPMAWYLILYL